MMITYQEIASAFDVKAGRGWHCHLADLKWNTVCSHTCCKGEQLCSTCEKKNEDKRSQEELEANK